MCKPLTNVNSAKSIGRIFDWQNPRIATTFAKKITKFLEKAEVRAKIAQVEIAIEDYTLAIDQVPKIEVFQRKLSCI